MISSLEIFFSVAVENQEIQTGQGDGDQPKVAGGCPMSALKGSLSSSCPVASKSETSISTTTATAEEKKEQ